MSANEPFGDLLKWKFDHLDSSFDKTKDAKISILDGAKRENNSARK
jgi:hypothetical protein